MNKYYYDLHIHSVLSSCADVLMSPNNIMNMTMLNELDFVSVTDHNSLLHADTFIELSESYDFIFIPGVEVTTIENIHVLCYFKSYALAMKFQVQLEKYIEKVDYDKEYFGYQQLLDVNDEEIEIIDYSLRDCTSLTINELIKLAKKYEAIVIPAHINKQSYSILNLDIDISKLNINAIELSSNCNIEEFLNNNKELEKYKIVINSDSHCITDISEKNNYIELEEKTIECFFKYFL